MELEPRNGAARALDALIEEHLPRLQAFVRLRLHPRLRARLSGSDIVQSVCGDLLRHRTDVANLAEAQLRCWLYTSVLNKIREKERYHFAGQRDPKQEVGRADGAVQLARSYQQIVTPSHVAMTRERLAQFERAFDQLPEHYREVITLSRIVGLSQAETADHMGRYESHQVNQYYQRGDA